MTSLKQQVAVTYGREAMPTTDDFLEKLLVKNKDNNVEREWRCFSGRNAPIPVTINNCGTATRNFSAPELKAVYLGLITNRVDKEAIIKLVKEKYKNTKVYQAEPLNGRYGIDFVQLGIK